MSQTSVREMDNEGGGPAEQPGEMKVVARALRVLFSVAQADRPLALSHLSQELGTPRPTVYRLVSALESYGLVTRVDGGVAATPRLFLLTSGGKGVARLASVAEPYLGELVQRVGDTAGMQVRVGSLRRCVLEIEGMRGIRWSHGVGYTAPVWAGAVGHVLLSGMSDGELDALLAEQAIGQLGSGSPKDLTELASRVQFARENGWSISTSEVEEEASAIAAPIRVHGRIIAGINLFAPVTRTEGLREAVPALLEAAQSIAQEWQRLTDASI